MRWTGRAVSGGLALWVLALWSEAFAAAGLSRFETFDRYDPTGFSYDVGRIAGEHVDPRTLGVSWDVEDFVVPGNGGLDLVISRSFNRVAHTPSELGHWYLGVPRIQIPTSPWRGPFDPALAAYGTFNAAWNNLFARVGSGTQSICDRAGNLVDKLVTGSLTGSVSGGILFAAPIMLHIPGEPARILLERVDDGLHIPATADYVTTDNWYADCLPPAQGQSWGGFKVVSPQGTSYFFTFIQYLVPGDYGRASAGGWIEMGISKIVDVHGNRIDYNYDLEPGGTALLESITTSDGRRAEFEYYPGSVLGVDVQGSPLALISRINIRANGESYPIDYRYCDFSDYYILKIGCTPIDLGADADLPVLHSVTYPNGTELRYRYNPSMYSANVTYDWGGFRFLLESVTLPTGGRIEYEYDAGYSAILQNSDAPAPRLSRRITSGRNVEPGEWRYTYSFADHIERTSITGPARRDDFEFYEGLGTYEWLIARYPGQHEWPDSAPTDYDDWLGKLRRTEVRLPAGGPPLTATDYEYAVLRNIGKSHYGGNWLGWPTLVRAQTRATPVSRVRETDYASDLVPRVYSTYTAPDEFDAFANPLVVRERGRDGGADGAVVTRRRNYTWYHDTASWVVSLPDTISVVDAFTDYDYGPRGLPLRISRDGVVSEFDYDATGNLSTVRWQQDGAAYYRSLSDYKRGVPRRVTTLLDSQSGATHELIRSVDGLGHITREKTADGEPTSFRYDAMGRLLSVQRPLLAPLTVEYIDNASGAWAAIEQRQGTRRRRVSLDGFGRATLLRDFADSRPDEPPLARSWRYDAAGRTAFVSDPFFWSGTADDPSGFAFTRDWLDRPLVVSHTADGPVRRYCYTSDCNTSEYAQVVDSALTHGYVTTDEDGYVTATEHVAFSAAEPGQPTRIVQQVAQAAEADGPAFITTRIERDLNLKVLAITQGRSDDSGGAAVTRSYRYDAGQRLIEETHPETGVTRHTYNERGLLSATTTAAGRQRDYRYDGLGRATSVVYGDPQRDTYFDYNSDGQLLRVRNGVTDWRYEYDAAGLLRRELLLAGPDTVDVRYDYNELGIRTRIEHPTGRITDIDVDELGRPRALSAVVTAADYWPNGEPRAISFANDVVSTFAQTPAGLLASYIVADPQDFALVDVSYAYDARGNTLQIEDSARPGPASELAYDGLSRLVQADGYWGSGSLSYDATGNIQTYQLGPDTLSYDYAPATNRLAAVVDAGVPIYQFEYDADGLQTGDGLYSFSFDVAAQLAGVAELPDLRFEYDGHGRRTRVSQDGSDQLYAYDLSGKLVYADDCQASNTQSDYIYLGERLVGRADEPCTAGCHP